MGSCFCLKKSFNMLMIHRLRLSNSYYSGKSASRVVDACSHRPTRRSWLSINPTQRFLIRAAVWGEPCSCIMTRADPGRAGFGRRGPAAGEGFSTPRLDGRPCARRQLPGILPNRAKGPLIGHQPAITRRRVSGDRFPPRHLAVNRAI